MLSVIVGNHGYYAEGELRDACLDLPVPPESIQPWLEANGLADPWHEEVYVEEILGGPPFGCDYGRAFGEGTPLQDLNLLAGLMEALDPENIERLTEYASIARSKETCFPDTVLGICNWLVLSDELPICGYRLPGSAYWDYASNEEKYGMHLALGTPWLKALDEAKDFDGTNLGLVDLFDFESFGRDSAINHGCALGENGYVPGNAEFPPTDLYSREFLEGIAWPSPFSDSIVPAGQGLGLDSVALGRKTQAQER